MPQLGDIYYRVNNYGEYLCLEEYSVVKVTPMGARVSLLLKDGGLQDKKHLIFNRSNNKFAWPDKESAIASFFIRKEYELSHAENRVRSIKTILKFKENETVKTSLMNGCNFVCEQTCDHDLDSFAEDVFGNLALQRQYINT